MNIVEKNLSGTAENKFSNGVSNDDAKKALELLLKWIGENPDREGLKETPKRIFQLMDLINSFLFSESFRKTPVKCMVFIMEPCFFTPLEDIQ